VDFSAWYLFAGQFRFLILQNLFLKHYDYDHADHVQCTQIYGMKKSLHELNYAFSVGGFLNLYFILSVLS
jgi:hypothetical protein